MGLKHEDQCATYALIFKNLTLHQANGVFWGLFATTVVIMVTAASCYGSKIHHESEYHDALDDPEAVGAVAKLRGNAKQSQLRLLAVSIICCSMQVVAIVFQTLAGLALHFCHQEDLVMFLWSTWSLLSLGSFFATLGIILSMFRAKNPPWNIPLGTPVLVFAGIGHIFVDCIRNCRRKEGDYQFPHAKVPYAIHRKSRAVMAMRSKVADRVIPGSGAEVLFSGDDYTMYFFDRLPPSGFSTAVSANATEPLSLTMSRATTTTKATQGLRSQSSPTLPVSPRQLEDSRRPDSLLSESPRPGSLRQGLESLHTESFGLESLHPESLSLESPHLESVRPESSSERRHS